MGSISQKFEKCIKNALLFMLFVVIIVNLFIVLCTLYMVPYLFNSLSSLLVKAGFCFNNGLTFNSFLE